jgi:hypothetical protein
MYQEEGSIYYLNTINTLGFQQVKKKEKKNWTNSHKPMWKLESVGFHKNLRTTQHWFELWTSKNAHNTIDLHKTK